MQTLYDSDTFAVLHIRPDLPAMDEGESAEELATTQIQMPRHGFEIVDKRSGKEVYLDGSWAEMFQKIILGWQQQTPTQEEVESTLDSYAGLAQNPVLVH
ncbi:BTH_I0359 family protein [Comamonas endophytica]|uniref:DUF3567 domain-containing protein n=1 Tax=Comamonas endophytica TaxID=2949090 RepID=A0ABY6G5V6_9BURK|nr:MULTISPECIES: DUF3567 domain-containing protein [unclassified Acidovorax]MCD2510989.1 DUF3567 domain-containing protein [Acidovorax sp. D4N7]UYG50397.1 DUF3567 domain-containing protein [Acidovorax sp. 5MLIR]